MKFSRGLAYLIALTLCACKPNTPKTEEHAAAAETIAANADLAPSQVDAAPAGATAKKDAPAPAVEQAEAKPKLAAAFTLAGLWSFNWMQPETSKCSEVAGELAVRMTPDVCKEESGSPFETDNTSKYYKCTFSDDEELMVFADKKTCEREYEAMSANAP